MAGNKMKEKLYTNREHEFLTRLLDLLEVPYTSTKHNDGITYNEVVFEPTTAQYEVIYTAMKYHYKEVMTR